MRMPFAWEPEPYPDLRADTDPLCTTAAAALVGHFPDSMERASFEASGELEGPVNARDTRDQLKARLVREVVDDTPAAREWAHRKAETALRSWDTGVRRGNIKHHTR